MSLRTGLIAYLVVIHLVMAGAAVLLVLEQPYALFAAELVLALSLAAGIHLVRRVLRSLAIGGEAVRLIQEQELTSRLLPVGDPDADVLIGVYNRMVDTLRAERVRVQEQQHFFHDVLQAAPSGLLVLDFDGHVSEMNPAAGRLLQAEPRAVIGQPIDAIPSALGPPLAAIPPGASATLSLSGPRRIKCHHGTFYDRGFLRHFLLLEELTEDLRQFERAAYEKLIRVMSHEVNNTVTAANSLLESSLTYAGELDPVSREDFRRAIGIAIDRMSQLSGFMRGFAEVYRLPPPVKDACELRSVLEPIVRLLAATPAGAGARWTWSGESALVVQADRRQLEQACLNILKNALEAAGPSGCIDVWFGRERGRPTLVVRDSGPGLDREAQENVFTPFFSTKPQGQGIGLTLVQEILTAHGCEFGLEGPAGGPTRFQIVFPE